MVLKLPIIWKRFGATAWCFSTRSMRPLGRGATFHPRGQAAVFPAGGVGYRAGVLNGGGPKRRHRRPCP
eukprot:4682777-Lingulodinium_polyedra.AAC.1